MGEIDLCGGQKAEAVCPGFLSCLFLRFSSKSLITVRWLVVIYFLSYGGSKPSLSTVFSMVNML